MHAPLYVGGLIADWHDIRRLDSLGNTIRTFDAPNEDAWFALNLDPDGQSFWSANFNTGKASPITGN